MSDDAVPDLRGYEDTDLGVEIPALNRGEAWLVSECAGLQFYAYGRRDDLTGERIMPRLGDRLHLVRDPENPHDANAVGVWWRNAHQIGHLPRYAAAAVAPLLDAGAAARGYVYDEGDGEAWSLRVLVVGAAAEPLYAAHIERVAYRATLPVRNEKRERRLRRRAERFADQLQARRVARVAQAVETLLAVPFEPDLPDVGTEVDVDHVARLLACSRSTVARLAKRAGIVVGRYTWQVPLTPEFDAEIRAWCRAPRSRLDPGSVRAPRIGCEVSHAWD
ncbi:HIRAN domain-containing protein [Methylobacterium fujisawaense]|uniref:HIRAN domain-containing protein n=1 Tax=Methylobacterium fujisawaense TaxID=107400 RepID=UPI0036FEF858